MAYITQAKPAIFVSDVSDFVRNVMDCKKMPYMANLHSIHVKCGFWPVFGSM